MVSSLARFMASKTVEKMLLCRIRTGIIDTIMLEVPKVAKTNKMKRRRRRINRILSYFDNSPMKQKDQSIKVLVCLRRNAITMLHSVFSGNVICVTSHLPFEKCLTRSYDMSVFTTYLLLLREDFTAFNQASKYKL